MKRRDSLRWVALGGGGLLLPACDDAISFADRVQAPLPDQLSLPDGAEIDPDFHLLSRAAYGPALGDLAKLKAQGREAWVDQQLKPESIDDSLCRRRARRFESLHVSIDIAFEFKKPVLRREIVRHTLLRAIYSRRQLFEVMVGFWSDHFNIDLEKGDCIHLKPWDDQHVIRKHALGNFRDMLRASITSPAMLVYLDGNQNKVRKNHPEDRPNENYARELLELHTMGAGRGYSQGDILEAARALSGWRFESNGKKRFRVYFNDAFHDGGEKTVLGKTISAETGEAELDQLVSIVCDHPATGRYLAEKLCRRFVGYDPPEGLVDRVAELFVSSGGEIRPMVREILLSDEFASSAGGKLKRPFHFVVSAIRGVGADTHAHDDLIERLLRMGQGPFQYPTPDGYPDEELPWLGTLLWRWNYAFELAGESLPKVTFDIEHLGNALDAVDQDETQPLRLDRIFAHLCGRLPLKEESASLASLAAQGALEEKSARDLLGVILGSPAFQRT